MVRQNLAKKTNNFEQADKDMAFGVWYVEKEFNVGPITEDFPLMKFLNLWNNDNIKRFNEMQKSPSNTNSGEMTLG